MKHTILILILLCSLAGCGSDKTDELRKRAENAESALRYSESKVEFLSYGVFLFVVVSLILWFRRSNQNQVINRTPAHDIVTDSFVIDGTNVVHGTGPTQLLSLPILVGLLIELHRRNLTYKCFFDANTGYKFKKANCFKDADEYHALCSDFPDSLIPVPGGNPADDFILDWAHRHGTVIISNDRFKNYFSKYSWLETDATRRVSFLVHNGSVEIPRLGIVAQIPTDLAGALFQLRITLKAQVSQKCNMKN